MHNMKIEVKGNSLVIMIPDLKVLGTPSSTGKDESSLRVPPSRSRSLVTATASKVALNVTVPA